MTAYIGIIHKQADSVFGISFPDFPGCIAAADTLNDAPEAAREALALYVGLLVDSGESLAEPRSLAEVLADPDWNDFQALIVVEIEGPSKQVRANISIDERLLGEIDRVAEARGMTRSGFLAVAAREMIHGPAAAKAKGQKAKRRAA
jgi:predicted RNase H-like HicB family nuclease